MSSVQVDNKVLNPDFKIGDEAIASDLEPETKYTATLTEKDKLLDAKDFTTLKEDIPDPDPVKPDPIPAGSLIVTPDYTTALIEDTDGSANRDKQHMFLRDVAGEDKVVNGKGNNKHQITMTGLEPDTEYPAGLLFAGWENDAEDKLRSDLSTVPTFKTKVQTVPNPDPAEKITVVPDITTAVITDTGSKQRTGQHMAVTDSKLNIMVQNASGDKSKSVTLYNLVADIQYSAGDFLVIWIDDKTNQQSTPVNVPAFKTKPVPKQKPVNPGKILVTPNINDAVVSDDATNINRAGQHIYLLDKNSKPLKENKVGDSSYSISVDGLTPDTLYNAGTYNLGWVDDTDSTLKSDTAPSQSFRTDPLPKQNPKDFSKPNFIQDTLTFTLGETDRSIDRKGTHIVVKHNGTTVAENPKNKTLYEIKYSDLNWNTNYTKGYFIAYWVDDEDPDYISNPYSIPSFKTSQDPNATPDPIKDSDISVTVNSDNTATFTDTGSGWFGRDGQHLILLGYDTQDNGNGNNSMTINSGVLPPAHQFATGDFQLAYVMDSNGKQGTAGNAPAFMTNVKTGTIFDGQLDETDGEITYNSDYQFYEARYAYSANSFISVHQPTLKIVNNSTGVTLSGSFSANTGQHNGSAARNYAYTTKVKSGEQGFSGEVLLKGLMDIDGFVPPKIKADGADMNLLYYTNSEKPSDYGSAHISVTENGDLNIIFVNTKHTNNKYYQVDGDITWSLSYKF